MSGERNPRVLVVDDNAAIRDDYQKILAPPRTADSGLGDLRASLFDDAAAAQGARERCEVECASQGEEGVSLAEGARASGRPFALAFVDMRMPPGIDGLETIARLWRVDPALEIVLCTAFSDHSWEEIAERVGDTSQLLILKKPFDSVEVQQIASTLAEKWRLARASERRVEELSAAVAARTLELAQANAELARQVGELERTNERLSVAMEEAGAASRAKTEFLTNMSHEIRTPMTAILGFADLLLDPSTSREDARSHVATLKRNGERLLALIQDILDLARIDAGTLTARRDATDVRAIVDELARAARERCQEKGLAFTLDLEGDLPLAVMSDGERLRGALAKLLDNAIKFTERGGVRLVVRAAEAAASIRLAFAVVDTGPGIARELWGGLFQPFAMGDSSTSRRHGGSGLGLSLAKSYVDLLGARLELDSRPNEGSAFRFEIEVGRTTAGSASGTLAAVGDARLPLAGRRILLAEDGLDNQRLIGTILRRAGAVVDMANDGSEVVERALGARVSGNGHDLVLMDMQMPRQDGYAATRILRERGLCAPIVALTAHAMSGDRERCIAAGCDDYLTKPVERKTLVETCARLVPRGPLPAAEGDPSRSISAAS